MAVVPVLLNLGQSNAGPYADYATWQPRNLGIAVDFEGLSSDHATGGYNDTFAMPGTWPTRHQIAPVKGAAVQSLRYLTFYNPIATGLGYTQFPHRSIVEDLLIESAPGATKLQLNTTWQYTPVGKTITRSRTGTTHTVTAWGGFGAAGKVVEVTPAFNPPPQIGEQIEYRLYSGAVSPNTSTVKLDMRFGGDFGNGNWEGSLAGMRLRCVAGTNVGVSRSCDALTLGAGTIVELTTTAAWPSLPQSGDEYVLEPHPLPSGAAVPFRKWGYFLPWSPLEGQALGAAKSITSFASTVVPGTIEIAFNNSDGAIELNDFVQVRAATVSAYSADYRVAAVTPTAIYVIGTFTTTDTGVLRKIGKQNPYPPGFSFPNHHDQPPLYQPFRSGSLMYGAGARFASERAAFHITFANRLQEYLGKTVYVASCAVGGASLTHNELSPIVTIDAIGWFDPRQQNYFTPGEPNGAFARVLEVLDTVKDALALQGDTANFVGITFVQGESDAQAFDTAAKYQDALTGFKAAVRQAIEDRDLCTGEAAQIPWIQPKVKNTFPWTYFERVNTAIATVAESERYMATCEVQDLACQTEVVGGVTYQVHYTGDAATTLAGRMFEQWRTLAELPAETSAAATPAPTGATDILALIDQAIASGGDVAAYTINGRTVQLRSMDELIKARKYFEAQAARANGLRRTKVRFG